MSLCQIKRKPLYLSAALRAGLGQNGVYGLRMMWDTMGELRARFGADRNDGRDAERLAASFGPMRFVHLQRRDLVAQAVSRHKAEVSGTWQLGIEEAGHPTEPFYDFAQINAYLHEAVADNGAWATWFGVNGVLPVQLSYEDLAADPVAATRLILRELGLTVPSGCRIEAPNRRMADDISADWVRRFRAQMAPAD